jgi:Fic family protein
MPTLARTNRYLASAAKRSEAVRLTIGTSSAIEGIHAPFRGRQGKVTEAAVEPREAIRKGSPVKSSRRA